MILELQKITFRYGREEPVIDRLDLSIEKGEIYSLLGGSGSGKTTILNLIAGFVTPEKGGILIDGRNVSAIPPHKRKVGMVFQDNALFPHMNVARNILYGVRKRGKERQRLLEELLEMVGLSGREKSHVGDLSGGEKQRVALARTLAYDPKMVLLDEPLSSLDESLRASLRKQMARILREREVSVIHVTHDQKEAMALADRIGILHGGKVLEEGSPEKIYSRPEKLQTARFVGISNIFPVIHDGSSVRGPFFSIPSKGEPTRYVGIRPDSIKTDGKSHSFSGMVIEREFRGSGYHITVDVQGTRLEMISGNDRKMGSMMDFSFDPEDIISLEV